MKTSSLVCASDQSKRQYRQMAMWGLLASQPSLIGELGSCGRSWHGNKGSCAWGLTPEADIWSPHTHALPKRAPTSPPHTYTHMYMHTHTDMHTHSHIHTHKSHTQAYTHMHTHSHIHTCIYTWTYTYSHMYAHTYDGAMTTFRWGNNELNSIYVRSKIKSQEVESALVPPLSM